jgi:hypothetical protein
MVETDRVTLADFEILVRDVARELVRVNIDEGAGVLSLPQTYPGGSPVVVRVRRDGDAFVVTDHAAGLIEADRLGGAAIYGRIAASIAKAHGVKYESEMMMASVDRDWLVNAIVFVSAASRRAVEATAQRLADEREKVSRERLRTRLVDAFSKQVSLDVEYRGRSTKRYTFDAMVQRQDHAALFDLITPYPVSVATGIVKFQDVARLDDGPRGVAVIEQRDRMDPADIILIGQAATTVIELDADTDTLRKAA